MLAVLLCVDGWLTGVDICRVVCLLIVHAYGHHAHRLCPHYSAHVLVGFRVGAYVLRLYVMYVSEVVLCVCGLFLCVSACCIVCVPCRYAFWLPVVVGTCSAVSPRLFLLCGCSSLSPACLPCRRCVFVVFVRLRFGVVLAKRPQTRI